MSYEPNRDFAIDHRLRFGQIAVKLGFINGQQLKDALNEQVDDDLTGRPHRFLGDILRQKQWLNMEQIDIILEELFQEEMRIKGLL